MNFSKYEPLIADAVSQYWGTRSTASSKQGSTSGIKDQGERSAVTAGNHLDGFETLCKTIIEDASSGKCVFHIGKSAPTLPGFYRPTKCWDLIATYEDQLVAVIEFKSQAGPSFGNNFNNRTEEVLGSSTDFWTAFREGAFGKQVRPFLGWIMLVEDCEKSKSPVRIPKAIYPAFSEFESTSYAERYDLLCSKLILENLYTHASLIMSERGSDSHSNLSPQTSIGNFVRILYGSTCGLCS